mmetsp:Transcript_42851/g.135076  ORF Transcript_42851/g.135076 Transcript_42851/m.135076 type:complete len:135 (-) Transcript_42851:220-624(-)
MASRSCWVMVPSSVRTTGTTSGLQGADKPRQSSNSTGVEDKEGRMPGFILRQRIINPPRTHDRWVLYVPFGTAIYCFWCDDSKLGSSCHFLYLLQMQKVVLGNLFLLFMAEIRLHGDALVIQIKSKPGRWQIVL